MTLYGQANAEKIALRPGDFPRTRKREWTLRVLSLMIGLMGILVLLEVMLHILPVHEGTHRLPVNEKQPIVRFEPNRRFVWSQGWNFSIVNQVNVNNFGFVNDIDYQIEATDPLLAFIGDSFVEALMVPFNQTCAGRVASEVAEKGRVYTFAVGGAPLSQYLAYARYARDTFHPESLVLVIIDNDYDESLLQYRWLPGNHHFARGSDGEFVLERVDYEVSLLKKIFRNSALARYLMHNLKVVDTLQRVYRSLTSTESLPGDSTVGSVDVQRIAESREAIDQFFALLPAYSGIEPGRIVFVMDGMRPQLYDEKSVTQTEGSYIDLMRRHFVAGAAAGGYELIDLHPVFTEDFKQHREFFEYPHDAHWNPRGHRLCFEELAQSEVLKNFGNQ